MKKTKIVTGIVVFIIFMVLATQAYQFLSQRYQPKNQLEAVVPKEDETGAVTSEESYEDKSDEVEKIEALDFSITDLEGNTVLFSDFVGKPIVVNFWASWCSPCKSEMPIFEKLYKEMGEDVTFLMVNMTGGRETEENARAFIEEQGYTFPVYFDLEQDAAYTYGITGLPTTLFIDKDGYLITGVVSMLDEPLLRQGIGLIVEQ